MELVHKKIGEYTIRIFALILAIELAFLLEFNFDITNNIIVLYRTKLNQKSFNINISHIVSFISTLIYSISVFIIIFTINLFGDQSNIIGIYLSKNEDNPHQINVFKIKANKFSLGLSLVGHEYKMDHNLRRTGSWRSCTSLDIKSQVNSANILYIYSGNSLHNQFNGHGYCNMTLSDNGTGYGYWLDNSSKLEPKITYYHKINLKFRIEMTRGRPLRVRVRALFPYGMEKFAHIYAALPSGHT